MAKVGQVACVRITKSVLSRHINMASALDDSGLRKHWSDALPTSWAAQ